MISSLVSLVYIRMQMRLSLTKVTGHTYSLVLAPPCFFVVVFFPLPQTRERFSRRRQTQGWICCFISGLESLLFGRKNLAQLAPPLNFGWKIRMSVCNLQVNLAASRSSGAFIIRSHRSRIFLQGVFFFFSIVVFFFLVVLSDWKINENVACTAAPVCSHFGLFLGALQVKFHLRHQKARK